MKKYGYIAWMFLCALLATACGDDDDGTTYEEALAQYGDWKVENEEAFKAIADNPDYTEIKSEGNDGSVYIQVMKEGKGRSQIYYTDSVRVYYTLKYCNDEEIQTIEAPYNDPIDLGVSVGYVSGWTIALQRMHIGDRWKVWIPWELGYGYQGKTVSSTSSVYAIYPFSALFYEIEVTGIIRDGKLITQ